MKYSQKGNILIAGLLIATVASFFGLGELLKYKESLEDINSVVVEQEAEILDLQNQIDEAIEGQEDKSLGTAFRPSGYTGKLLTRLTEGGSETTFRTTPNTAPDGSTLTTAKLGDFIVITVNPGADNEEKISVSAVATTTGGVAIWTIVNRGLSFTENVAVTANKRQHAIGETVIISNDDHFLSEQYPSRDGTETINGAWTFTSQPTFTIFPITPSSSPATATTTGTVELATGGEAASSTLSGDIATSKLALHTGISTSSAPSSGNVIVVTGDDGNIDAGFVPAITDIQVYTASTTWTKPDGTSLVEVIAIGGGGGGGGGGRANDAAASSGGGGGAGGGYVRALFSASNIGATSSITVGLGGAGGAGGASNGNAGATGTPGQSSSFGTLLTAQGGNGGAGGGAAASAGGTGASSSISSFGVYGVAQAVSGAQGSGQGGSGSVGNGTNGIACYSLIPCGGGAGEAQNATNNGAGYTGGSILAPIALAGGTGGTDGGTNGTAGSNGTSATSSNPMGGAGGGGGASAVNASAAGDGGAGGSYGGGGGGGGASENGTAGNGGAGGTGVVIVISYK